MLKKDFLEDLAVKNQTTSENVYREYVQNVFLNFLYQEKTAKNLFFKGGTALKLAYGSPRFSEDLDFSLKEINFNEIEKLIFRVLENLDKELFQPSIIESKETTGGYLADLEVNVYDQIIKISIQGSQPKKGDLNGEIKLIVNDFIPSYSAVFLESEILIEEKISAALTRSKPRDFFDVYFLIRGGHIPIRLRPKLWNLNKVLEDTDIDFKENLSNFLPYSMQELIKEFPQPLLKEINRWK